MYDRAFGIRWEPIAIDEWNPDPPSTMEQKRRDLSGNRPDGDSIALGMLGPDRTSGALGLAVPFDPRLLVFDSPDRDEAWNEAALAHELAHLFGAWHSSDPASLLHAKPGAAFDRQATEAIRLTRSVDFRTREIGPETVGRLTKLWLSSKSDKTSNPFYAYSIAVGNELLDTGHPSEAAKQLSLAAELAPDDSNAHYALGAAYLALRRFQEAAAEFRTVTRIDPHSVAALTNLGGALLESGVTMEAATALEKAAELSPNDATVQANAGVALARLPDRGGEAIAHLREALRLDPDRKDVRKVLDSALARQRAVNK